MSFETCREIYLLRAGEQGRTRHRNEEIAAVLNLSSAHVRNLVRFYRYLPNEIRTAWETDQRGAFTFSVLSELTALAKNGDTKKLQTRLSRIVNEQSEADAESEKTVFEYLSLESPSQPTKNRAVYDQLLADVKNQTAESSLRALRRSSERRSGLDVIQGELTRQVRRLESVGTTIKDDDRARMVLDVLRAAIGEMPLPQLDALVGVLLADLGFANS